MERAAGVLLPVSSLPSRFGIGCFDQAAYNFIDWLKAAGQTYWQVLPMGPTGYGDSPYQAFSTYAGNPYFISLDELIEEGVLTEEECAAADPGDDPADVNYGRLYEERYRLLRMAYERSNISENEDYLQFLHDNNWWLVDYSLFMAVKGRFDGKPWTEWAEDIRFRYDFAMEYYQIELYFDVEFQKYMQYKFFRQYQKLRTYANERGIKIIGDIPIYVPLDSADVWAHPELFQLDENNVPVAIAGCPPDGFSAIGQVWGNPLYRWEYHKETDYDWWVNRVWFCFRMFDVVRIDHFRGFDEFYAIPYGAETAVDGWWNKGPGIDLFRAIERRLGWHPVIAEDLGYVTDSVRALVKESGFPGMKVVEFAFDSRDTGAACDYLPHNYGENSVAYTGTHDNETLAGWFDSILPEEQEMVRAYLCDYCTPKEELHKSMIALVMRSASRTVIVPLQDYLGLDNSCRMNQPSTMGKNWRWRVTREQLSEELKEALLAVAKRYGRMNKVE